MNDEGDAIKRVDEEGFHGFRVLYRAKGEERLRSFADEKEGSASKAFRAAVRFQLRLEIGAPVPRRQESETGIPGVMIGWTRTSARSVVMHYTASWYDENGRRVARVFSWRKYGKKRALELAAGAREKGLAEARRKRRLRGAEKPPPRRCSKSLLDRSKPTKHENIGRADHHDFHGYVVRLTRAGARHSKYFSDKPDGKAKALERAIEYRDAARAALPAPIRVHRRSRASSTGTIGVVYSKERTRSGGWCERFSALWFEADGRRRKQSFSVGKYGYDGAKERAERARDEGVAKLLRDRKAMILAEIERRKRAAGSGGRPSE
jgi:hypothetical protein